jgi:hypothetical protein
VRRTASTGAIEAALVAMRAFAGKRALNINALGVSYILVVNDSGNLARAKRAGAKEATEAVVRVQCINPHIMENAPRTFGSTALRLTE